MKTKLCLFAMLALITAARGATNDLSAQLQKGLFEEEANRDLTAAIANYQALANDFDKDRQIAATAVFRLGECYRKLGKTNEAVIQYQRILKEFSDQQTLVMLSRQNLTGLGGVSASTVAPTSANPIRSEQLRQLEWVKKLQDMPLGDIRQIAPTVLTDATLINLIYQYNQADLDLVRLRADHAEEHPEVQKEKAIESALQDKIKERLQGMEKALSMETGGSVASSSGGGGGQATEPVTDEEQQEIRRIQLMIQNSPDLINAPGGGPNGNETPLIVAAMKGQLVVAKYLLDHGAAVDAVSGNHVDVALASAARNGHKAMVELLLSRGADVNGKVLNPLFQAVEKGYLEVAETLLAHNADVNTTFSFKPIHSAARNGRTELLQLLIKHGADVNATDDQGQTPLELAAMQSQTNCAKLLLDSKASIDVCDKYGMTPLHQAASAGSPQMVSLLLNSGATVDVTNRDGTTPLMFAVAGNKAEAVRVLLEHKANPNRPGMGPYYRDQNQSARSLPIIFAIWKGNDDILKMLLDAGANAEGETPFNVPLFTAIDLNRVDAVQLLLEHGANPNRVFDGYPALNSALRNHKDARIASLLLDKGANANAKDKGGWVPLTETSDPQVGRWLVQHKADVNARIFGDVTALMSTQETNYIQFLVEAGAKPDLQDTNGNTALHHQTIMSNPGAVAFLLGDKANPNIQNNAGYTPLDLARSGSINGVIAPGLWSADSTGSGVNSANEREIADLLINAGGLANLPKRNRIEVRRASNFAFAFTKGSHDWNRYSLLEMIAGEYHLLSQSSSGEWRKNSGLRNYLWNDCLRFPDFKNVIVYRREDGSAKQKAINVDVEGLLSSGDCSRDMRLDWGDVIEIPESDHPVDVGWTGLSAQTVTALTNCLARQVTVTVKGVSTTLKLMPEIKVQYFTQGIDSRDSLQLTSVSFMLRSVLDNSKLVRVSSDLSRVKVTRMDPETKKKQEWVIDCTDANANQADLWLRDGDVVEVPEK